MIEKHVLRHSRHQYFENNFLPAPLHPLYYTILLYVLPKLLGGELDSPQSEVLGTPRPDYTILYDYTFRAKVIEGGVD